MPNELSDLLPGKPWPEMTKAEKRAAYDAITDSFRMLGEALEKDINELLEEGLAPLRASVKIELGITDNREDPRLP